MVSYAMADGHGVLRSQRGKDRASREDSRRICRRRCRPRYGRAFVAVTFASSWFAVFSRAFLWEKNSYAAPSHIKVPTFVHPLKTSHSFKINNYICFRRDLISSKCVRFTIHNVLTFLKWLLAWKFLFLISFITSFSFVSKKSIPSFV